MAINMTEPNGTMRMTNKPTRDFGRLARHRPATALLASALALATAVPVLAQDAGDGELLLEEIIVTARKRVEKMQDTPISIAAFSEAGIEARQVQQIASIAQFTPNLTFETAAPISGNSAVAVMFIRGIGQVESIPTVDLGVGLYVDGVYLARSVGGVVDLLDVERVEVLRGPQGTLFGRNTIGGAISITTAKPDYETGGSVSLLYGSDDHIVAKGSVNVPLTSDIAAKLSAAREVQNGYVKHGSGTSTGDKDRSTGRLALRAQPSDALTIDAAFDVTRERTNGAAYVLSDTNAAGFYPQGPDGVPTPFPANQKAGLFPFFHNVVLNGAACAGGAPPATNPPALAQCFGQHWVSPGLNRDYATRKPNSDLDIWGGSVNVSWDLDAVELRSITAYRDVESAYNIDQDHTPVDIAYVDTLSNQWQFSEELQLLGKAFDDKLNYLLGAFYFKEKGTSLEHVTFPVADFQSGGSVDNDSIAFFAQSTAQLAEGLSLTGGIRFTRDAKRFLPNQYVISTKIGIPAGTPLLPNVEAERVFKKWTPMVNLAYRWDDALMTYATYSEGFKSGGFTQRVFPPIAPAPGQDPREVIPSFAPEIAKVKEVGFKSDLAGKRLRLNGALFHTIYRDVQVTVQNVSVAPIILNAAKARIAGGELELTAVPMEGLQIEGSIGYTDADYRETAPGAQVTADSKLIKTPEWSLTGAVSYAFQTGPDWTVTPRLDWSYRTGVHNNSINSPQAYQPGYHLVDAGIAFDNEDAGWTVLGRVRNIGDERFISGAFSDDISLGLTELVLDRGREWSLSVRKRF